MTERQMIEWYIDLFTELYRRIDTKGALIRRKDGSNRKKNYTFDDYVFTHTVMLVLVRNKLGCRGRENAKNRLRTLIRNGLISVENQSGEQKSESDVRLATYGLRYRITQEAHRIFNSLVQL